MATSKRKMHPVQQSTSTGVGISPHGRHSRQRKSGLVYRKKGTAFSCLAMAHNRRVGFDSIEKGVEIDTHVHPKYISRSPLSAESKARNFLIRNQKLEEGILGMLLHLPFCSVDICRYIPLPRQDTKSCRPSFITTESGPTLGIAERQRSAQLSQCQVQGSRACPISNPTVPRKPPCPPARR